MPSANCRIELSGAQSRRDDTLLTVVLNLIQDHLRKQSDARAQQSPCGTLLIPTFCQWHDTSRRGLQTIKIDFLYSQLSILNSQL